jgi:SulP family sulfate permease
MKLQRLFPVFEWLPKYQKSDFRKDLVAGITVSVMLVPQGMAYALLAGMPPIYGLYGGLIPLFLYGVMGTSRQMSIGPVAISALLVLAGISQLAEPLSEEYISLVILTGLLIGVTQVILGFLKLGFLVNFLSHPVVAGFTSAAAVIIAVSQLKYLLGFEIPRYEHFYETISYAVTHIGETNLPTVFICLGGILTIVLLRRIKRSIPGALIVVIVGILLVKYLNLDQVGVDVVGRVPKGLPGFIFPEITFLNVKDVMPTVLTVTIIGIVESIGIAKVLESKHRSYRVRANQELFALGFSKIGGAFFQSLPTSGSFTRSAVNNDTGARTGMSSVITSILIAFTLLFLTPLFYYLPTAILAAIIFLAVKSLFDFHEAVHLWNTHRRDFAMMIVTFVMTLFLGIEMGVFVGVVLSLGMIIYSSSKPHVAVLGRLPNSRHFRNISRFPNAIQSDEILIFRFDSSLYFGNATYFRDIIRRLVIEKGNTLKILILEASTINEMDSTGLQALEDVIAYLRDNEVELYLSGVKGPVRDLLTKAEMMGEIGTQNQFMTLHDAVEFYKNKVKEGDLKIWSRDALQTNVEDSNGEK